MATYSQKFKVQSVNKALNRGVNQTIKDVLIPESWYPSPKRWVFLLRLKAKIDSWALKIEEFQ